MRSAAIFANDALLIAHAVAASMSPRLVGPLLPGLCFSRLLRQMMHDCCPSAVPACLGHAPQQILRRGPLLRRALQPTSIDCSIGLCRCGRDLRRPALDQLHPGSEIGRVFCRRKISLLLLAAWLRRWHRRRGRRPLLRCLRPCHRCLYRLVDVDHRRTPHSGPFQHPDGCLGGLHSSPPFVPQGSPVGDEICPFRRPLRGSLCSNPITDRHILPSLLRGDGKMSKNLAKIVSSRPSSRVLHTP